MGPLIAYHTAAGHTAALARKLTIPTITIGGYEKHGGVYHILMTPTYGGPRTGNYIPKPVITHMEQHHQHCVGIIGTGNKNFHTDYCKAAHILKEQYNIPILHRAELMGTTEDKNIIEQGITQHWARLIAIKEQNVGK